MFDLFEVFVKQLFQNPKHYCVRAGGNPKPQLASYVQKRGLL